MYRNKVTGEVTDDPVIVAIWREEGSLIEQVDPATGLPASSRAPASSATVSYDPDDDQASITIVEINVKTGLPYAPRRLPAPRKESRSDSESQMDDKMDDDLAPPPLVRT